MLEILTCTSGNYLVTHAVGGKYLDNWTKYSRPSWQKYCERHDLGILVFDQKLLAENSKNIYWDKFLIPKFIRSNNNKVINICYLDTDIIINPYADNIFNFCRPEGIGLVSQVENLPYGNLRLIQKKIAYHRNRYLSESYPLQSSLFMPVREIYKYHGLKPMDNYACMGLILFNLEAYSETFFQWYQEVPPTVVTIDGSEETYLNYFIQSRAQVNWLSYTWQSLWIYEMSLNYSFLYERSYDKKLIRDCITNSMKNNNFLHFAGSWESFCWRESADLENLLVLRDFKEYYDEDIDWTPKGQIKPSSK